MPVSYIQPSFTGGELSPSLHARVDLAKYAVGLKTCRNFFVLSHGGVSNRSGTKFITEVKDSSKQVRLIPFEFNTEQTYILEMGNLYLRIIKDGGQITSGGSVVEITTPYVESDLFDLQETPPRAWGRHFNKSKSYWVIVNFFSTTNCKPESSVISRLISPTPKIS